MEDAEDFGGAMRENPMQLDMNDSDSDGDVEDSDDEEKNPARHNPIYCAYADNEPLEAILSLIEEDPTWVQEMDSEGWTLLHNLLNDYPRSTLPGVVRRVVEVWPGSVREWTESDTLLSLPLHVACSYDYAGDRDEEEFRSEAIRIMVEAWPGAVQVKCNGKYPLDTAVRKPKLSAIRCLVEAWSGAVEQSYRNGTFLMHEVLRHEAAVYAFGDGETLNVIQYLAEQRPQSVRDVDRHGRLPLHLAVENRLFGTASFLVEEWQGSVKVSYRDRELPIHLAVVCCRSESDLPLVRFLVQQWPESLHEEVQNGWLPLHLALWQWPSEPRTLGAVQFLVSLFPEAVNQATAEGYLPLHIAAGRGITRFASGGAEAAQWELDLVRFLFERSPESVRAASRDGSLPLHCASRTKNSIPAAQFLVEQYREAIHTRNNEGQTPLLVALGRSTGYAALGVERYREAIHTRNNDDRTALLESARQLIEPSEIYPSTELVRLLVDQQLVDKEANDHGPPPLHFAIANGQPLEVLTCLVEHHPVCLLRKDKQGSFAIHVAVAHSPPLSELVRLIVARRPESVKDTDDSGSTPLHVAVAQKEPSLDLVQFLVKQPFPTVQARDGRGLLPLQVAAASDAPLELLYWLAMAWPEAVYSDRLAPTQTYIDRPTRPKRPKYR